MSEKTMSINQALAELKVLRARIEAVRQKLNVAQVMRPCEDKIGAKTREEFMADQSALIQQHQDLLAQYQKIKAAITIFNATTRITVAGEENTIAAVIERKRSMDMELNFLRTLQSQYTTASERLRLENSQTQAKLEQFLTASLGTDKTRRAEDVDAQTKLWEARNKPEIVCPAGLTETIEAMRKSLDDFTTEINWSLTDANARGSITI